MFFVPVTGHQRVATFLATPLQATVLFPPDYTSPVSSWLLNYTECLVRKLHQVLTNPGHCVAPRRIRCTTERQFGWTSQALTCNNVDTSEDQCILQLSPAEGVLRKAS